MSGALAEKPETRLLASLPMYDFADVQAATDAFWNAISTRLKNAGLAHVPAALTRLDDYGAGWRDPNLLLGQTCGFPFLKQLSDKARIVATPRYNAPGCEGFEHRSFFIVNAKAGYRELSDLRGHICALNGFDSNTGMNLLRASLAPLAKADAFFSSVIVTGSHHNSLAAVAEGQADIASIDCVSFAHLKRLEPELIARVSIIGQSQSAAAPPFITSLNTDEKSFALLRKVLSDIAVEPELAFVQSALGIDGFVFDTDAHYEKLLRLEEEAAALGYPELR